MKNLNNSLIYILLSLIGISSCKNNNSQKKNDLQSQFENILDIQKIPKNKYDLSAFGFSDEGAWHAYSLPHKDSTNYHGAFIGPLLMKMWGQWLAPKGSKLVLSVNNETDNYHTDSTELIYYPGKLVQHLQTEYFKITRTLVFTNNRIALMHSTLKNISGESQTFNWKLQSDYFGLNQQFVNDGNKLRVVLPDSSFFCYTFEDNRFSIEADTTHLQITFTEPIKIQPCETIELKHLESYFFNQSEFEENQESLTDALANSQKAINNNTTRWSTYLKNILDSKNKLLNSSKYQQLAVKCVQTMISNWRSPAGALKHNGMFPSAAYHGFYGFWSWDSWKHVVALSKFNLDLARESMRSMFQFQDKYGMVADCVYQDSTENNWRDTKPPLAAWAVWKVFESSNDTAFVSEMYPKLVKYHNWWYIHRDVNKNDICEYGSTDGTLIAAKWESGMDNAVRFDDTKLVQTNENAWSMNQESVDLNVFLQKVI